MLQPGVVAQSYVIELELGGGGMARVYRVRHEVLGSIHALKVLDPELAVNAELRARFLEEGRIQAQLRHPNIVAVTDIVVAPGIAGLVMDFLEGLSLEAFIESRGSRPPSADEVREIFRQVLAGVGFAHAQGYVHRDLKPSNIFLQQVHGRRIARILDFGIAKAPGSEDKRATRTGARLGTPHYMSPEQVKDPRDATPRSDVFSLGVTLYELATGKRCFDGDSEFLIMRSIVQAEFLPPEQVYPGIDPGLAAVIHKAMAPDPAQRFASCEEFSAALDAPRPVVMSMSQVKAAPPTPPPSKEVERRAPPAPPPARTEAPRAPSWLSGEAKAVGLLGLFGVLLLMLWLRRTELASTDAEVSGTAQPSDGSSQQDSRPAAPSAVPGVPSRGSPAAPVPTPIPDSPPAPTQAPRPAPTVGRLRLEVNPKVGVRIELTDPRGEQRFLAGAAFVEEQALPGRWKVRATALEHAPEERDFDVEAGESVMVQLSLARVSPPPLEAVPQQEAPSQAPPPEPAPEPAPEAAAPEPPPDEPLQPEEDAVAAAPERAESQRFAVEGFTVRDTRTGLLWTRRVTDNGYSWDEAQRYCGALVIADGGWRLPERSELADLVRDEDTRAELLRVLTGGVGGKVWSSTSFPGSQFGVLAWTAHLVTGDVQGLRTSLQVKTLCVR